MSEPLYDYPPMPPQREDVEESVPQPEVPRQGLTRAEFLMVGGLATFGSLWGGAKVANRLMMRHWPENPAGLTIEVLDYNHTRDSFIEGFVVAPGLGGMHGGPNANTLKDLGALRDSTPIGYITYPPQGFEIADVTRNLKGFVRHTGVDSLSFFGISMGGPTLLRAARDQDVPLRRITFNCSPERMEDARLGGLGKFIAARNWDNEPLEKMIGAYVNDIRYQGFWDFEHQGFINSLKTAYAQTETGASPHLLGKQLQLLAGFDFMHDWKSYRHLLRPNFTEVLFCAPNDLSSDMTVDDWAAYQHWQEFFAKFGVPVKYQGIPRPGHAQVDAGVVASKSWQRKTNPPLTLASK